MLIKNVPCCERPRERLLEYGTSSLSNIELLAILLKTGTKGESVTSLATKLMNKFSNINDFKDIRLENLIDIKGIGKTKAIELLAAIELGRRIYLVGDSNKKILFNNSRDIYLANKHLFDNKNQEYFYCLYLNSKKELIERKLLFMGTLNRSIVHPREIFKEAYLLSASSIVCMHNHPSGDITPSYEDILLTKSLHEIGRLQQIPVVDHIIFGNDGYYSFYENESFMREL